MTKLILCFAITASLFITLPAHAEKFYDFKYTDTNKKEVNFKDFKINIATRCGFTGQLDDLEKLYQTYKNKNFIVVGFPSNDFKEQSPESNEDIANICRLKYGVTFPIFEKQIVLGKEKNQLYKWMTSRKNYEGEIGWNFTKFLVDKNGNIVARFDSGTEPMDPKIISSIEKNL